MSSSSDDELEYSAQDAAQTTGVTSPEEEFAHSKLRNNIAKKGANSYYYAHAKKLDAPVVRSEPPQELVGPSVRAELPNTKLYLQFPKFAWLNEAKMVKVYVTFENAHLVEEEKIELQLLGARKVQFKVIDQNGGVYALVLDKLKEDVDSAVLHKNRTGDKFRILLTKKDADKTWYRLQE